MSDHVWIIQIAGIFVTIIITVIGTTWTVSRILSRHEIKLTNMLTEHQLSDNAEFARIRHELNLKGDDIRREFGETGLSLRQGVHDLEMAISENKTYNIEVFARRESMIAVSKEIADNLKALVEKVDVMGKEVASMSRPRGRN